MKYAGRKFFSSALRADASQPSRWMRDIVEAAFSLFIVGLLIALALPHYLDAIRKARVSEVMLLAGVFRQDIGAYYALSGHWPERQVLTDWDRTEKEYAHIRSISLHNGAFTFVFAHTDPAIDARRLSFRPALSTQAPMAPILWLCGYSRAPQFYKTTAENLSDIPQQFLPHNCKG